MNRSNPLYSLILLFLFSLNLSVASAQDFSVNELRDFSYSQRSESYPIRFIPPSFVLAQNILENTSASADLNSENDSENTNPKKVFEEPRFSRNKIHQYLGLASLFLATATIPTRPSDESGGPDSLHSKLAVSAYALGAAAVATGFMYHSEDILNYGMMDPDNLHMALGLLGTLGYLGAVANAPESVHAASGVIGLLSMGVAIGVTW